MAHRVTCILCELSICRRCVRELFNFTFGEKERLIGNTSCSNNIEKEVITQLLKRIKIVEEEIERLALENYRHKDKGEGIQIEELAEQDQRFDEVEIRKNIIYISSPQDLGILIYLM